MPSKFRPSSIVTTKGAKSVVHYYVTGISIKELKEHSAGAGSLKQRAMARKELSRRGIRYED